MNQVHKETLTTVENALPNRQGLDVEIFGMEGVPEDIIQQHNQRIIQNFYTAQAERHAATGNPPPGQRGGQGPSKKIKMETPEEIKKRLADHRAKVAAAKAAGINPAVAVANPPVDGQSPGQAVRHSPNCPPHLLCVSRVAIQLTQSYRHHLSPLPKEASHIPLPLACRPTLLPPRPTLPYILPVYPLPQVPQAPSTFPHDPPMRLVPLRRYHNDRPDTTTMVRRRRLRLTSWWLEPQAQEEQDRAMRSIISSAWQRQASSRARTLLVPARRRRARRRRIQEWCTVTAKSARRRRWRCCRGTGSSPLRLERGHQATRGKSGSCGGCRVGGCRVADDHDALSRLYGPSVANGHRLCILYDRNFGGFAVGATKLGVCFKSLVWSTVLMGLESCHTRFRSINSRFSAAVSSGQHYRGRFPCEHRNMSAIPLNLRYLDKYVINICGVRLPYIEQSSVGNAEHRRRQIVQT